MPYYYAVSNYIETSLNNQDSIKTISNENINQVFWKPNTNKIYLFETKEAVDLFIKESKKEFNNNTRKLDYPIFAISVSDQNIIENNNNTTYINIDTSEKKLKAETSININGSLLPNYITKTNYKESLNQLIKETKRDFFINSNFFKIAFIVSSPLILPHTIYAIYHAYKVYKAQLRLDKATKNEDNLFLRASKPVMLEKRQSEANILSKMNQLENLQNPEQNKNNLQMIIRETNENNKTLRTDLDPISSTELSKEDQVIVDFYNRYKNDTNLLKIKNPSEITPKIFEFACQVLGLNSLDIQILAKENDEDNEKCKAKIEKAFREQARFMHPDKLLNKKNQDLTNISNEVINILADAKNVLIASLDPAKKLYDFAEFLSNLSISEIKEYVNQTATKKFLNSIKSTYDLSIALNIYSNLKLKVFWEAVIPSEFFSRLPSLINDTRDISILFFDLPKDKHQALWELTNMLEKAISLIQPDCYIIIEGLGPLPPTSDNLSTILTNIPSNKIMEFLNHLMVKEQLPVLIKNKQDVDLILNSLKENEKREAYEIINNLPFVQEIIEAADKEIKAKNEKIQLKNDFIKSYHPNLLKIKEIIKQSTKELNVQINEDINTKNYCLYIKGYLFPETKALTQALEECSQKHGFKIATKNTYINGMRARKIVLEEIDSSVLLSNSFQEEFKAFYEKILPIECYRLNISAIEPILKNLPDLTIEILEDTDKNLNYIKITFQSDAQKAALIETFKLEKNLSFESDNNHIYVRSGFENKVSCFRFSERYQENLKKQSIPFQNNSPKI